MTLKNALRLFFLKLSNPIAKKNTAIRNHLHNLEKEEVLRKYFPADEDIIYQMDESIKIHLSKKNRLSEFILFHDFEKNEISVLLQYLKQDDIVLDIGANIGFHALFESKAVGANGQVYAFEPVPATFNLMQANIKLNNFKNILPVNLGLSDKKSELSMNVSLEYDAWNTLGDPSKMNSNASIFDGKVNVKLEKLDDFIKDGEIPIDRISFVKIDVEGWEKFVLLGGSQFFKDASPVLMIEFDEVNAWAAGYLCHELYDLLNTFGYQIYSLKNGKLFPESKKLYYPSQNLFAVKNDDSDFKTRIPFGE